MSSAPIYYFRDDKTGADTNAIAGSDASDGLSDANAKQTYEAGFLAALFDSAPAGTRFRFARGCAFTQASNYRLNNQNSTVTVTSITRSGTTATATTDVIHNLEVGDVPNITGCDQSEYNIAATITAVPTTTTFEFTVAGSPTTPATTSDKIRQDGAMIYIEEYVSTEFTPDVDAKPYCTYTSTVNRQHRLDRDGMEGYSFRNMHYEATVTNGHGCFYLYNLGKDTFIFDDLIMDSYRIAIDSNVTLGAHTNISLTNSTIQNCWSQGWLGGATGLLIDNNTFTNNGHNITGGVATLHNVYLNHIHGGVFSNNTCYQSAMNAGEAVGTSVTLHGVSSDVIIEDNHIYEDIGACAGGAYGIAVNTGYSGEAETFTDCIVRRNRVENMGNRDIVLSACVRAIVENNIIIQSQTSFGNSIACISAQDETQGTGNADNLDCIIRNNSMYGSNISTFIEASEGTGFTIVSNVGHSTDTGVVGALDMPLSIIDTTNYDVIDNNTFYAPNASTFNYEKTVTGDLAAWQTASIFDDNSAVGNPLFTDPSNGDLTIGVSSPLVDNGHLTLSSSTDYLNVSRDATPDIGAYEYVSVVGVVISPYGFSPRAMKYIRNR